MENKKKEKNIVYPFGESKKYPVEEATEPQSTLVQKSLASISDDELMGISLDKALERELRKHQFMQSDIPVQDIKKNFANKFVEDAATRRAELMNKNSEPFSFTPEKIYHDTTGMGDKWVTENPKLSDFSMNPDWNDIQKQKAFKNSLSEYSNHGYIGMKYPTYPEDSWMDPRHPDYDRAYIEESMKPGNYNVLHPAEDINEYEKYWRDINRENYKTGKVREPTYAEWRAAKKFELGTPSEPVVPSLLQLATIMGLQKATEIPEAGKDSDVVPEDEMLDRRFKKLKTILGNK